MEENLMTITEEESAAEVALEDTVSTEEADLPEDGPHISEIDTEESIEESVQDKTETLEDLRAEIESLRSALADKQRENERVLEEIGEFTELFPKKSLESVPEEVWDKVKSGVPLAAAYALYEKKAEARAAFTEEVNRKNAERSSGAVGREVGSIYYSPSEVKKMSAAEVKKNYAIIIESMKKWN
ncbi:MAG: hypothetical protein E7679_02865 [Ruminococcaceae bacterium]|nr:hypothetical protein [Oscillospiraceae bacterium]